MDSFLFPLLLGALIIIIGVRNLKGDVGTLHRYHRKRVSEEDLKPFGRKIGTGTVIVGCAIIAKACAEFAAGKRGMPVLNTVGMVVLVAGLVIGFAFIFYALFKYNKGVF